MSMDLQEGIPIIPEDMRPRPSSKKSSKSRSSDDESVTFGVNGPSIFNSRVLVGTLLAVSPLEFISGST